MRPLARLIAILESPAPPVAHLHLCEPNSKSMPPGINDVLEELGGRCDN